MPDPAALAAAKADESPGIADAPDITGHELAPVASLGTKLDKALSSNDDPRFSPPDMGFAVSGDYKMQQINVTGRIWDAANTPLAAFDLSSFFLTSSDRLSDPTVLFDAATGVWIAAILDETTASERLAVSATSDPTGTFYVYDVPEGPADGCPDQGKVGLTDDVIAISANEYSAACGSTGSYQGVVVTVANKAELLAGASSVDFAQGLLPGYSSSLVPVQSLDSTSTQWFVGVDNGVSTVAHVVAADGVPPDTVFLSEVFTPSIRTLRIPAYAAQLGGRIRLATGDNRVQTAAWQANSLTFTATDGCTPAGDTVKRSCARVVSLNTYTGGIKLDQSLSALGRYLFYPAARPDAFGSIVLGYGRSSSSLYPELDVAAGGPFGGFGARLVAQAGGAANNTGRYGDYFSIATDPSSPTGAWVAGEVGGFNRRGANGWSTAARRLNVRDPAPQPILKTLSPSPSGNGRAVAFDPAKRRLFYTNSGDANIYVVTPGGAFVGTITPTDAFGTPVEYGALSWDAKRKLLWGGRYDGTGEIDMIAPTLGTVPITPRFAFPFPTGDSCYGSFTGYLDGLAYDEGPTTANSDDTLWFSDDAATTLFQTRLDGTLLKKTTTPGCNTGITVDRGNVWLALQSGPDDPPHDIVQVSRTNPSKVVVSFRFSNQEVPGPEDIEIDRVTAAPGCVLWTDQYETTTLRAWKIPCS